MLHALYLATFIILNPATGETLGNFSAKDYVSLEVCQALIHDEQTRTMLLAKAKEMTNINTVELKGACMSKQQGI